MAERECTDDDNKASHDEAQASGKLYGPAFVEILGVDATTRVVSFRTAARDSAAPVTVKCAWTRNNVWARCPSTLNCDEQRLPAAGSTGTLYLSEALVETKQLDVNVKWPNALGASEDYRPLRIWPTSIEIRGVELFTGQMRAGTLELMDPGLTAPDQTLTLHDRVLTINVSQAGAGKFLVPWPALPDLEAARAVLAQPHAPARDKARAWAQVAVWEELLNGAASHTEESARAQCLLNEIRETAR